MPDKTELLALAGVCLLLAACNPAQVCHEGKLYEDANGDGIFTEAQDVWEGGIDCVEPAKAGAA